MMAPALAAAQPSIDWTRVPSPGPIARIEDSMVYDSVAGKMIMFGGYDLNFNRTNDIWEYDGTAKLWTNVTPSLGAPIPPRRSGQTMAYDPVSRTVILFGGLNDSLNYLGDTWEWNTVTRAWAVQTPPTSPSPRQGAKMVYDALNGRLVLFGGVDLNTFFQQTWVWNLSARTWSQLAPTNSPSGRTFHGMVYNTFNSRVTVFGGIGYACPGVGDSCPTDFSDLWELTATGPTPTWTLIAPGGSGPAGRGWMGIAYDSAANRIVMYGGFKNIQPQFSYGDTWSFSGGVWTQIYAHPTSPPLVRDSHQLVYDITRNRMVLFGGYLADVWEFAGSTWTHVLTTGWPPAQDRHAMAYDSDRDVTWMVGGGAAEVWEFSHTTSSWLSSNLGGPTGRIGTAVAYDQPRRKMILFGGQFKQSGVVGSTMNDTWAWDTNARTWTNMMPAGSPPVRLDHAMAYDAAHNVIVMFGGRTVDATGAPLGDTWLWNGSTWTNAPDAGGPPARFGHAIAYDPVRQTVVLFGGANATQRFNDVWEWNGVTLRWQLRMPAGSPPARVFPALAPFDATMSGLLMFGGSTNAAGTALLADAWVWNGTSWSLATVHGSSPSARQAAKAIYSASARRLLLFGGRDSGGVNGDIWLATVSPQVMYPYPVQVTPSQTQGSAQTFTALYRASGSPLNQVWFLINSTLNLAGGVLIYHGPGSDQLLLRNDANTAWQAGTIGSGVLSNGQVTLDLSTTTASSAGGDVTLSLPLIFKGSFNGPKNIYMFTADTAGNSAPDGWRLKGTYFVNSGNTAPATVSVTPSSGTGMNQRFTAVYRDVNGVSDLQQIYFLINPTQSAFNGVYLYYVPAENRLYLRDNGSTTWGSGAVPGSTGTLSNGQVSINAAQITVTRTATDLTLSVALAFTPAFAGAKNVYLYAVDFQGATPGAAYQQLGAYTVAPRRGKDVDGDGRTDLTVFRPGTADWFVRKSRSNYSYGDFLSLQWGVAGDLPLAADFDGDGMMDLTVFRPSSGEWFVRYSSTGYSYAFASYQWGLSTDTPLVADFDGDGKTDLAVYRPSTGEWLIRTSSTSYSYAYLLYQMGVSTDRPIPADFDGDGRADLAVYRPSTGEWLVRFSSSNYSAAGQATYSWGLSSDLPLLTDFDGDGRTDLVVYRPGDGTWYVRFSSSEYSFADWTSFQWGVPGDTPLVGDFDGDGKTDLTIFRPSSGEWFIRYSSTGYSYSGFGTYQWGVGGDVPMMPR
jgi:hypothetical protein